MEKKHAMLSQAGKAGISNADFDMGLATAAQAAVIFVRRPTAMTGRY
jgi:hypothetical protein